MSDETRTKSKPKSAASTEARARRTTPRGGTAEARVPEKPRVAPKPAAPKPAAKPAAKTATRSPALKTTALKSAALKAAAAPRPEPVASEAAEVVTPADRAPAAARTPSDIPAPSLAPRTPVAPAFAAASPAPAAPTDGETPDLREEAFSAVGIAHIPAAEELVKPYGRMLETGADGARTAYAQVRESNETLAQACFESATATSRGMAVLNAQVLDLMRANTDLTLSLMRSALTVGSLSEAVKLQTSGARLAYETTSAHLRAIADTTTKLVGDATGPITQAMTKR